MKMNQKPHKIECKLSAMKHTNNICHVTGMFFEKFEIKLYI